MPKPTNERIELLKSRMPHGMLLAVKNELKPQGIYWTMVDNVLDCRIDKHWGERHDLIIETVEKHLKERGIPVY